MSNKNPSLLSILGVAAIAWLTARALIALMPMLELTPLSASTASSIVIESFPLDPDMIRIIRLGLEYFDYLRKVLDIAAAIKTIQTAIDWLMSGWKSLKAWWKGPTDQPPPAAH